MAWPSSFTKEPKYKLPHWVPKDSGTLQSPKPGAWLKDKLEKTRNNGQIFISKKKPLDYKHNEGRTFLSLHLSISETSTVPGNHSSCASVWMKQRGQPYPQRPGSYSSPASRLCTGFSEQSLETAILPV